MSMPWKKDFTSASWAAPQPLSLMKLESAQSGLQLLDRVETMIVESEFGKMYYTTQIKST
jgi:hypothetical protein